MCLESEQLWKPCAEIDGLLRQSWVSFCFGEQCFPVEIRWQGNHHRSRWTISLSSRGSNSRARFANQSKKRAETAVLVCGLEWIPCFTSVTVVIIFQSEVICELLEA